MIVFKEWVSQQELLLEKKGDKHSFSCVMALFNAKDAKYVLDWSNTYVKDKNLFTAEDGGMGREDEIHVTVLYGLHTNNVKDISKITDKVKPFDITLGKVSKFESNDYDVLKIDVKSDYLHTLNAEFKKMDYTSKFDKYVPHCTIAYVKKGSCDHLLNKNHFEDKKISINSLTFSSAYGRKTKITLN